MISHILARSHYQMTYEAPSSELEIRYQQNASCREASENPTNDSLRWNVAAKALQELDEADFRHGHDLPPLKRSSLKYDFRIEDEIAGKEEAYS